MRCFIIRSTFIFVAMLAAVGAEAQNKFDTQTNSIHPYFGVSGSVDIFNLFAGGTTGWEFEGGMRSSHFYVGLEYGQYFVPFPPALTEDLIPGYVPPPGAVRDAHEQFLGLHAGYVFPHNPTLMSFGFVFLYSYEPWEKWDSVSGWTTFTKTFLNIGPDFRFYDIANGHLYLDFAYTLRRALKAGLGFMF